MLYSPFIQEGLSILSNALSFSSYSLNRPLLNGSFHCLPSEQIDAIVARLGCISLASLKLTCRYFNKFTSSYFPLIVSSLPRLTLVNASQGVTLAVHDMGLNMLVVGWKEELTRKTWPSTWATVYDLHTGKAITQLTGAFPEAELRHLLIDAVHQRFIAALKCKSLITWGFDGALVQHTDTGSELCKLVQDAKQQRIFAANWQSNELRAFKLVSMPASEISPSNNLIVGFSHVRSQPIIYDASRDRICTHFDDKAIHILSPNQEQPPTLLKKIPAHSDPNSYLYLEHQGKLIFKSDDKLIVFDLEEDLIEHEFALGNSKVSRLCFDEETDQLLALTETCDMERTFIWISCWNLTTGKQTNLLKAKAKDDLCYLITSGIYMPKKGLFIAGTFDGSIAIYDLRDNCLVRSLKLPTDDAVGQISFDSATYKLFITTIPYEQSHTYMLQFKPD